MRSVSSKNPDASWRLHQAMLETSIRCLAMARWSAAGLAMAATAGCFLGEITGDGLPAEGLSPEQQTARMKWTDEALPVLRASCSGCHAGGQPMIGFLSGMDDLAIRDRVMTYDPPVVNLDAATSSRLLTKSAHQGPALTPSQTTSVLGWVQAEARAKAAGADPNHPAPQLATPATAVSLCVSGAPDSLTCPTNHVSLATIPGVGSSIPGAEIAFTAYGLTDMLYLTNFKFHGGTAGAYLEHLLVVSVPIDKTRPPVPDPIDRYFALKLGVKPNDVVQIDGGTAAFNGFSSTDQLAFHFKVLTPFKSDSGGPMTQTGCKVLAKFKTNAVMPLTVAQALTGGGTNSCVGCHAGGNSSAKGAMDLTQVNATGDAMVQLACNEVRTRINLTATDQSAIYFAPDPARTTTHPIKLTTAAFASFKTSVDVWAKAEQTAP